MNDYGLVNPTPDGLREVQITELRAGDNFMIEGQMGAIFRATSDCTLQGGYFEVLAENEEFEAYPVRFAKNDLAYAPKLFLITAVQPVPVEDSE